MKHTLSFLMLLMAAQTASAQASPVNLRCEHLVNPMGIDARKPRLTWQMNDTRYGAHQTAYRISAGTDSAAVADGNGDMWESHRIPSDAMLAVYDGKPLEPFTKYYWSVRLWDSDGVETAAASASFETGMMRIDNWRGAWISDGEDRDVKPAPYFRREFLINKKIKRARAYIAAAGLYELYINGNKVGDHRLDPAFTRYDRRTLYVTYDITPNLNTGANAAAVLLGNGWYNHQSLAVWDFERAPWRSRPAFCMDIRITYEDGTEETIATERNWKTAFSPVTFNSIYTAEHYDARLEQPNWNATGFDDSKWRNASYRSAPSQNIVAQSMHPIRNVEEIKPARFMKMSGSRYIYDLGRNIAGVSRLRIKGEAGTVLRLRHAEILLPDTVLYMKNIAQFHRSGEDNPFATDIFTLKGGGAEETFMPHFNYKGFQYVEVTADRPVTLTANSLTGVFMHTDLPAAGGIKTSNPLINRIWQAANNSYLSNLYGYPTDCPQREKNGWTGDAQLAADLALYNFDGITLYEKWMADHLDEQQPNGVLPSIVPTAGWGYEWATGPDWTGGIAIIPWAIYQFYGDTYLVERMYDAMKRYVDNARRRAPDGLCDWGLGDWIPIKSQTPQKYTTSIYYYRVASTLAAAAKLLGRNADYGVYSLLAEKIRTAINSAYLNAAQGVYGSGNQTEQSTALLWGIAPDTLRALVARRLAERVIADNRHIDVGMLGSKSILQALSDNGYADLAYELAAQRDYPSWGYWIARDNATTLYEAWQAIGDSRESDGSLNHIIFGEISAWFYRALGGINTDPLRPAFANILLKPHFVKGLDWAEAWHDAPQGRIESRWERRKGRILWRITIPANASADIALPASCTLRRITAAGKQINPPAPNGLPHLTAGKYEIEAETK